MKKSRTYFFIGCFILLYFVGFQVLGQSSDQDIMKTAQNVRSNILRLSDYGVFDDISFGIRGSRVILQGYASRPTLKESAERAASRVEGVDEVENNIEVLPQSRNDDEIRLRAYVAIYGHPSLQILNPNRGTPLFNSLTRRTFGITQDPPPGNHPIKIIVKNGNITLEGIVNNAGQKSIAGIQANGVPGVFSVTNDLVIPE